jgi:sulfide:quinone oxidoreductase
MHEFSKDLYAHGAFKNESSMGKSIFQAPAKGHFYKLESDVLELKPQEKKLVLQEKEYTYDFLIMAAEAQFDLDGVKNLEGALKDYWNSHVLSNAQLGISGQIPRVSREFRGGNMVFALPKSPYKNEGTNHIFMAIQELNNDKAIEGQWYGSKYIITTADSFIHRVPFVNDKMKALAERFGVEVRYNLQLQEIQYNSVRDYHRLSTLVYKNLKTGETETINYGGLLYYPGSKVPKILSPLVDESGFIPVDKHTLQHKQYKNVFALGDCTDLPTINNCIAVASQAHNVAYNVDYMMKNMPLKAHYHGESATPIFTGMHKLILPGFDYSLNEINTKLTSDTSSFLAGIKQSLSFKLFKRYEKKWFEKKLKGKIYGPPGWTKGAAH